MKLFAALALAALTTVSGAASAATIVNVSSTSTDLGAFSAGKYHITVTGLVSLIGPVGTGFDIDANGIPAPGSVSPGYPGYAADFNPNGSYTADGNFGPGGTVTKFGGLLGSFNDIGTVGDFHGPLSNIFNIGTDTTVTLGSSSHIYALVHDTYYDNDFGSFAVTITAVPEPATWAMLILGFFGIGFMMRGARRRDGAATA